MEKRSVNITAASLTPQIIERLEKIRATYAEGKHSEADHMMIWVSNQVNYPPHSQQYVGEDDCTGGEW